MSDFGRPVVAESGVRSNRSLLAAQRLPICRSAKSRQSQSPSELSPVRIATDIGVNARDPMTAPSPSFRLAEWPTLDLHYGVREDLSRSVQHRHFALWRPAHPNTPIRARAGIGADSAK